MSLFANLLLGSTPSDPQQRLVREAITDYFTLKEADEASGALTNKLFGHEDLDIEDKELNIAIKRRQLEAMGGDPESGGGSGLSSGLLAALGLGLTQRASPKSTPPSMKARFLTAVSMDDGELAKELGNVRSISRAVGHGVSGRRVSGLF